ncbi:DUF5305 domain-containing protein [Halorubrum sp. 2020YC2]|uniref:DUF5305 domain-containing protein n=1 Tax=Halorubrum sp. 2020YC2 TaxID=2836432 RepID=UPI001BE75A22|nr:DUF5305 domain-containing protein [Halorubrum sp. 2020YC2]QWC19608.1 DUF5305 domain-containing protein [Halorubrum sp. 2020YC2]
MSSGPNERRLRLRAVLNEQSTAILVACLLLAAVGAGLAYTTHVDPGTETETRTVSSLTVESEYRHSATVTEPNAVFQTGAVLDGRDTYFARIAPELDVDVATSYAASSAENVTVEVGSTLVVRNVGEGDVVYWRDTEPLASETVSNVAPGETVNASFTLNSTAIDQRTASIEEQLGASPGETETFVTTEVAVDGSIGGVPTATTQTLEMALTHGGATYAVDEPGVQSDTTPRTVQETVEREYGALRSFGGPLLLLAGLVGAGGIGYATREYDLALTSAEREYLSYRDDRSEFAEWITTFRLPASTHERPTAEAESLRDLVDFAIDNDTGVVEDPQTGAFHAVSGEFVYTYRPPAPATGDHGGIAGDDGQAAAEAVDDEGSDDEAVTDADSTAVASAPGSTAATPSADGDSPDEEREAADVDVPDEADVWEMDTRPTDADAGGSDEGDDDRA